MGFGVLVCGSRAQGMLIEQLFTPHRVPHVVWCVAARQDGRLLLHHMLHHVLQGALKAEVLLPRETPPHALTHAKLWRGDRYGVASDSRIDKIIGLFCKRAL